MTRGRRVDLNQAEIARALKGIGASVDDTHAFGHGFPDLAVGFRGVNYFLEVKSKTGVLTPDERVWHGNWNGQVVIVRSVEEAIKAVGGE
jgi:hypothetical protein